MKKPPAKPTWSLKKWQNRCAWCSKKIISDASSYTISIALRDEAIREVKPGGVEPMLLYKAGKSVPMIIVADDSLVKARGKDAMFQLCSEDCAKALQAALRDEMTS